MRKDQRQGEGFPQPPTRRVDPQGNAPPGPLPDCPGAVGAVNGPILWTDATCPKVRRSGRILSVAVIIAIGANADGRREVLGLGTGTCKAGPIWTEFPCKMTRRGA